MRSGTVFVSLLNKTSSGGKGETWILARSLKRGCIGSCQDWIWFQVVKVYILTSEKGYCLFALFSYCSLPYKRRFSKTLKLAKTAFILRTVTCQRQTFLLAHSRWGTFHETSLSGDERGETSAVRRLWGQETVRKQHRHNFLWGVEIW